MLNLAASLGTFFVQKLVNTSEESDRTERFGEVAVGSDLLAHGTVSFAPFGRQYQDRDA